MTNPEPLGTSPVDRRTFLKIGSAGVGTLAAAAAIEQTPAQTAAPKTGGPLDQPAGPFVDVNVYLERWPFRRIPGDETAELVSRLRARGVSQAWAGSFDALFHRDLAAVNTRLATECRRQGDGLLIPFGAINPKYPDWQEDVRRCQEVHGMPGIRLHPNYHGYNLWDLDFLSLMDLAIERKLVVQIALTMEDERTQHPVVQVPHVDATPLYECVRQRPELRLVLINPFRILKAAALGELGELPNISFDIASLEVCGAVGNLAAKIGDNRVLFGSYSPVFIFESARFKLHESPLTDTQIRAIGSENAKKLLTSS
jgi:predicted TIM-barrel fold metal-dependent hydrolase